jgi:hypothetical protein
MRTPAVQQHQKQGAVSEWVRLLCARALLRRFESRKRVSINPWARAAWEVAGGGSL